MPDIVVNLEGMNQRRTMPGRNSSGGTRNTGWANQQHSSDSAIVKIHSKHSAASERRLASMVTIEKPRLMIENLNELLSIHNVEARFFVDSRTERRVVRLHEEPSKEIIRQVPTQEFLSRVAQTRQYIGLIFDKKA